MWKAIIISIFLALACVNATVEEILQEGDSKPIDFYDSFYVEGVQMNTMKVTNATFRSDVQNNIISYTKESFSNYTLKYFVEEGAYDFNDNTRYSYDTDTGICTKFRKDFKYKTLVDFIKAVELNGKKESEVEVGWHTWKHYASYLVEGILYYDTVDDESYAYEIRVTDIVDYLYVNNFSRSDHIPAA